MRASVALSVCCQTCNGHLTHLSRRKLLLLREVTLRGQAHEEKAHHFGTTE